MIYYPRAVVRLNYLAYGSEDVFQILMIPRSLRWECNDARHADTAEIRFDYSVLPMDPRLLRDASVDVFFDNVPPGDSMELSEENLVFTGIVDTVSPTLADDMHLLIKARDNTAHFLDRKVPLVIETLSDGTVDRFGKPYDLDRPLHEIVEEMFEDVGPVLEQGLKVFRRYVQEALASNPRHILGRNVAEAWPHSEKHSGDLPGDSTLWYPRAKDSLWKVLSQICERVAALPFFDRDVLRIESVEDIPSTEYTFVYGENVADVTVKKDLNAVLARPIILRAENPQAPEGSPSVVEVRHPPENAPARLKTRTVQGKQRTTPKNTRPKTAKDDAKVIYLQGAYTKSQLEEMARSMYVEARRHDLQGTLSTSDLVAYNFVPSLRNGDSLNLALGAKVWQDTLALPTEQAVSRMMDVGLTREGALDLLRIHREAEKPVYNSWFVLKAKHSLDSGGVYKVKVDFTSNIGTDL